MKNGENMEDKPIGFRKIIETTRPEWFFLPYGRMESFFNLPYSN
jgi:hypothetical protein